MIDGKRDYLLKIRIERKNSWKYLNSGKIALQLLLQICCVRYTRENRLMANWSKYTIVRSSQTLNKHLRKIPQIWKFPQNFDKIAHSQFYSRLMIGCCLDSKENYFFSKKKIFFRMSADNNHGSHLFVHGSFHSIAFQSNEDILLPNVIFFSNAVNFLIFIDVCMKLRSRALVGEASLSFNKENPSVHERLFRYTNHSFNYQSKFFRESA